jgi:hypothetical protein
LSHFAAFSPAKLLHKPMDNMAALVSLLIAMMDSPTNLRDPGLRIIRTHRPACGTGCST